MNGNKYNDVIKYTDKGKFEKVTFKITPTCGDIRSEIIDTGYNLVFCSNNGNEIPIEDITSNVFVTKFDDINLSQKEGTLYALRKEENYIHFDSSISSPYKLNGKKYDCNNGVCSDISIITACEDSCSKIYSSECKYIKPLFEQINDGEYANVGDYCCIIEGVECKNYDIFDNCPTEKDREIITIEFNDKKLKGSIPLDIGKMRSLEKL